MNILYNIEWNDILFGGFFLGILKLIWDSYKYFHKNKLDADSEINLVDIEKMIDTILTNSVGIQDSLKEFVEETGIPRVVLYKVQSDNKSKIISANDMSEESTLTALYEIIHPKYIDKVKTIKGDFHNYILTDNHKSLIFDLIRKLSLDIDNQTNVKIVRELLDSDVVQRKYLYLIDIVPKVGVFYLALDSDIVLDNGHKTVVQYKTSIIIQKLKDQLKEIYVSREKLLEIL